MIFEAGPCRSLVNRSIFANRAKDILKGISSWFNSIYFMETVYVLSARFMNNVGTVRLITGVINAIIYFVKPQLTSLAQLHNFRFTSFKLLLRRQLSSPRDGRWSSPGLVLALQFICSFEFFMRRV